MNKNPFANIVKQTTAAARYDKALSRGKALSPVPEGTPEPEPTSLWPAENVALLERYLAWLLAVGAAESVIAHLRIPMAGHVLGLNLKPYDQLDLDDDLEKGMAYILVKGMSDAQQSDSRFSLNWFRRFLKEERGLVEIPEVPTFGNASRYQEGLPAWLLAQMEKLLQLRQAGWRQARMAVSTYQFWQKYTRVWRWLYDHEDTFQRSPDDLTAITRKQVYAYIDEMLAQEYAPGSINLDVHAFQSMLRFLQGRGYEIPAAILTLKGVKTTDSLPRFLTDEQVRLVRDDLLKRAETAKTPGAIRIARLDLAAFYLLWQGGMRVCELEDLMLDDLYLPQRRIIIRRSKGLKDRTVYLTETAVSAVEAYLDVRGPGISDHLFLYRHKPMSKDLVRSRLKGAGKRTGVKVTPHMLRHTFGTQLVNAGCRVTTIQMLLGHKRLNTTMIYTRVHNETVVQNYYRAMAVIEERLQPHWGQGENHNGKCNAHGHGDPAHLLSLVAELALEPLTDGQQAVLARLHDGVMALAGSSNGTTRHVDQVVKEQEIFAEPLVTCVPSS